MPPSTVVTVIVAVPALTAVTTPSATVATASLLDIHVTALLVALSGVTVAVRANISPSEMVADVLSRLTLSTETVSSSLSPEASCVIVMVTFTTEPTTILIVAEREVEVLFALIISFITPSFSALVST